MEAGRGAGVGAGARSGSPRLRAYAEQRLADAESGVLRARSARRIGPRPWGPSPGAGRCAVAGAWTEAAVGNHPRRAAPARAATHSRRRQTGNCSQSDRAAAGDLPRRYSRRDGPAQPVCEAVSPGRPRPSRACLSPGAATVMLATLNDRDRALWATAMYAGLRRGELMALRWSDVDLSAGRLKVERSYDPVAAVFGPPKSRAGPRVVPIPAVLREHLGGPIENARLKNVSRSSLHGRRWRAGVAGRTVHSTIRQSLAGAESVDRPSHRAGVVARVPTHLRDVADRCGRDAEGRTDVYGPQLDHDHLRSLRAPIPGRRGCFCARAAGVSGRGRGRSRCSGGCSDEPGSARGC